jgi:protein-tyrosine phosphatase
MAEAAMRRLVEQAGLTGKVVVSSAGTGDYHVGESADERAAATLRTRAYDPDGHRARQFTAAGFASADLVVALDRSNEANLRRLAPTPADAAKIRLLRSYDPVAAGAGDLDVPDPYFGAGDGFETALDLVESACRGLLDHLRGSSVAVP